MNLRLPAACAPKKKKDPREILAASFDLSEALSAPKSAA
jgi:hypothetical protein